MISVSLFYYSEISERYKIYVIIPDLKKKILFTSLSLMATQDFT